MGDLVLFFGQGSGDNTLFFFVSTVLYTFANVRITLASA